MNIKSELMRLVANGLTFEQCIEAFGVDRADNPFAKAASKRCQPDDYVLIDETTVLVPCDTGCRVLAWMWVSYEDAGILKTPELLELVLEAARSGLQQLELEESSQEKRTREVYADWLEDLITNYADELDGIAKLRAVGLPGDIYWRDESGEAYQFMPSSAIALLNQQARQGGLADKHFQSCVEFIMQYGNKLDAVLTTIQIAA